MSALGPFSHAGDVHAAARRALASLSDADWQEAFAAHPQIGAKSASQWSTEEQSGVNGADAAVRSELAELNRAYFEKFGFIFIVCATGKSAPEMLALLKLRLQNDAATELHITAAEQARITHLRLDKLLAA